MVHQLPNPRIQDSYLDRCENPDRHLVERARSGDVRAFDSLLLKHKERISRTIYCITKSREDTEDQVQETFLRAHRGISGFQGNSKFGSWLTRIAINQALMCLRKRRIQHVSFDESICEEAVTLKHDVVEWRPGPEESLAQQEIIMALRDKVRRLPSAIRSALILRDLHEYTTKEVSLALGISLAAVKSRVLRGRRQLRNQLDRGQDLRIRGSMRKH